MKLIREQEMLKNQLIETDDFSFGLDKSDTSKPYIKRIAGVDISASKTDNYFAVAAVVILDFETLDILYQCYELVYLKQPYVPGFLAFREVEPLVKLFTDIKNKDNSLMPELILVDGNGIFHCNRFGLASHLGVLLNIPTIGCSKTIFAVDGLNKKNVRALCLQNLKNEGDTVTLKGKSGLVWGAVIFSFELGFKKYFLYYESNDYKYRT
jgi:endonuclease V